MIADLLEKNRAFDAEYRGGLSNHLSMALVALQRLGAGDERLGDYFQRYQRRLEPLRAAGDPIRVETWQAHLGSGRRYADYLAFFGAELGARGLQGMLTAYLPPLVPGLAAAAFHAPIRLAYALEAQDAADAAASLAYFADSYLPFGPGAGAAAIPEPPLELLRRVAGTKALAGRSFRDGLITEALGEIAALPAFSPVIDWLPAGEADEQLASIAEAALVLYASTANFTALHGLTGCHALRLAWPQVGDRPAAARYLFQALAAAYVSIGTPPLLSEAERARLARSEAPSWDEIAQAARQASDEHVIKLVYSAREEDRAYPDALYRHVAARKAGLLPAR